MTDLTRNSYSKLFVSISCDVFLYLEEFQKDNGVNHPQVSMGETLPVCPYSQPLTGNISLVSVDACDKQ